MSYLQEEGLSLSLIQISKPQLLLRYTQTNTVKRKTQIKNRMKIYQTIILLCFFSMLFYNCSLPADDEEKGDLKGEDTITPELPWEGEMDKFTINSKEGIHLNDPQEDAGTAYVTIPSTSVKTPVGNLEFASPSTPPPTIMHDVI